ncbi:HAD family hydrolase [Parapedobacter tibetensis]|uniref:HAD family hydrolase n=1 Tax=Parapedobacter tibetensis TaxID=2972951 RepID=UPI00214D964E|nr:HAD family phosphatase [Parapedobacter tibetensis]
MQNIKNIIFDYGNVIFSLDFARLRQAFMNLGLKDAETFFSHSGQSPLFDAFDKGELTVTGFHEEIRRTTGKPTLKGEEIDHAWNTLLVGVPDGYHQLLRQLRDRYRTFLLSNNNEIHYQWITEYLKREHDLEGNSDFFEKDYYSHLMGMRKPDPEIFRFVLDTHGLDPQQTVFIDDSPQHIASAKKIGLQAQLLEPGDTLPALLNRIGVK